MEILLRLSSVVVTLSAAAPFLTVIPSHLAIWNGIIILVLETSLVTSPLSLLV